jgi:hypothetical protein
MKCFLPQSQGHIIAQFLYLHLMRVFILLLFVCLFACKPAYKPHKVIIEPNYVEVQFGRVMSRALLDSIQTALEYKGIHMTYTSVKYDGNKLNELGFLISDGINTGTAKTNFVNKVKPFGFRIDRRPGAKKNLQVGELD